MPTTRGPNSWATGKGYKYAHDAPHSVATQQYPPDDLVGRNYYEPTANGAERDISTRLERLRRIIRASDRRPRKLPVDFRSARSNVD